MMMHLKVILVIFLATTCTVISEFLMNIGFGEGGPVPNNTLVILKEGFNMKLWCDGGEDGNQHQGRTQWDSCSWFRPNLGSSDEANFCKYDERFQESDCPQFPQFSTWNIQKVQTRCVLAVTGVNQNDLGGWKCLLMPNQGSSIKEAILRRMDQQDPSVNFNPGPDMDLTVGESIQLLCNATVKAKNKPDIVWSIGSRNFSGNKHIHNSSTDTEEIQLWKLDSALDYMAASKDDQAQVKCTVFVRDDFGNLIETSIPGTELNISPVPQEKSASSAWVIVISIIIPLIIIIIIIVILIWCFGCFCFGTTKDKQKDDQTVINSHHASVPFSSTTYANTKAPIRNRNSQQVYDAYDSRQTEEEGRSGKIGFTTNSRNGHNMNQIPRPQDSGSQSGLEMVLPVRYKHEQNDSQPPGDHFTERLPWDPVNHLNDQLINYCYEGSDSETGSLSSISSGDESEEESLGHQFHTLGSPFQNLADLYSPDSDSQDSDSSTDIEEPFVNESWV